MHEDIKAMIDAATNDLNAGKPDHSIVRSLIAIATLLNESRDGYGSFAVATFSANT